MACHKFGSVLHGWPSYRIDLIVGKVFLFIQLIRSHGLLFEKAILWILLSKNSLFAIWVFDLNSHQCLMWPILRYLFRLSVHTYVHYSLECFVMYFFLAWECYALLKMFASRWTVVSRFSCNIWGIEGKYIVSYSFDKVLFFFAIFAYRSDRIINVSITNGYLLDLWLRKEFFKRVQARFR